MHHKVCLLKGTNSKESVTVSVDPSDIPNSVTTTLSSCSTSSRSTGTLASLTTPSPTATSKLQPTWLEGQTQHKDFTGHVPQPEYHPDYPGNIQQILPVLDGTTFITDLGHETEVNAHHTLLLSKDGTSTVRIQTKDEEANSVMIAGEPLE
ncbi:hypothetical protein K457DRAFT_25772 [Linnemannia elongata AG-77]|uniref:Uncharacterized protein n=1 Tax=Linnemannia elongata AG-77 TaxID=1314771 RepID=A0A197JCA0_9FUNG|nr:hypothetical protein K457DRAFT_25772 [Linnemannia elongata AG-77]